MQADPAPEAQLPKDPVGFEVVTAQMEKHEVSRTFAAMLQLINNKWVGSTQLEEGCVRSCAGAIMRVSWLGGTPGMRTACLGCFCACACLVVHEHRGASAHGPPLLVLLFLLHLMPPSLSVLSPSRTCPSTLSHAHEYH